MEFFNIAQVIVGLIGGVLGIIGTVLSIRLTLKQMRSTTSQLAPPIQTQFSSSQVQVPTPQAQVQSPPPALSSSHQFTLQELEEIDEKIVVDKVRRFWLILGVLITIGVGIFGLVNFLSSPFVSIGALLIGSIIIMPIFVGFATLRTDYLTKRYTQNRLRNGTELGSEINRLKNQSS